MLTYAYLGQSKQAGAALVVALVFLIALTLLGLASMGGNVLQQRMAYSAGETNLAFQGSESAVVTGEFWLEAQAAQPVPDCPTTAPLDCGSRVSVWPARLADGSDPEVRRANVFAESWWQSQGRPVGWRYQEGQTIQAIPGQAFQIGGTDAATGNPNYPRYVVEELGKHAGGSLVLGTNPLPTLWYYQITGRGNGQISRGQPTVTQSVYARTF